MSNKYFGRTLGKSGLETVRCCLRKQLHLLDSVLKRQLRFGLPADIGALEEGATVLV